MSRWSGKVAVVTGASAGIGRAIALTLSQNKVIVVALARRQEKLDDLVKSSSGKIYGRKCDLQKEDDILSTFRWVEETLGGVDIIINNAAVAKLVSLIDGETSQWREMINTNLEALNICTREALKTMRKRGDNGHIIHINSVAGHIVPSFPTMPFGIYAATKHAVTALTEAMRIELQAAHSKIRVTSISPGAVKTDMLLNIVSDEEIIANNGDYGLEEEEFLLPEDIADTVMYILSTRPKVQIQDIIIQPVGQKYS